MSKQNFWEMGGYAFYVWSAYGFGLLVLLWNLLTPRLRRTAILRELLEDEAGSDEGDR